MVVLQARGLTKSIGVAEIFNEVGFNLHKGEKVGLVGVNGAGKTTLLRILAGEDQADRGEITCAQGTRIGYLSQHFVPDFQGTVWELMLEEFAHLRLMKEQLQSLELDMAAREVYGDEARLQKVMARYSDLTHTYEQAGGYSSESKVRGILIGLGFSREDFSREVHQFSGGQKTRLALGKLLLTEPEILLLDEPTNHLDINTVEWLEGFLQDYAGAVVVVSHDRYFLDRTIQRIFDLEAGSLREYNGNFSRFQLQKAQLLAAQEKEFTKQQVRIARLEAYIERNRAGIKSKQARGRQSLLDRMEKVEAPQAIRTSKEWQLVPKKVSGQTVLTTQNLAVGYTPEVPIVRGLNLHLRRGEKIGLIGANGTGKSTVLKTLIGLLPMLEGEVALGSQVTVGYFAQDQQDNLYDSATLIQAVQEIEPMGEAEARNFLARFLFTGDDVFKRVKELSGGERARLILARLLLRGDNFLVLDEPTNHLDMGAKEVLEESLSGFSGTLLVVSHDRYFLDQTVTGILELEEDCLREYPGDYTYYRWKKQQLELAAKEEAKAAEQVDKLAAQSVKTKGQGKEASEAKGRAPRPVKKAKLPTPEELEAQISVVEDRLAELAEIMALPETYQREDGGLEFQEEYQVLELQLKDLYEAWEGYL